jgi:hypothetical protein
MNDLPLGGKRVLFFCPKTFNYENEILHEMEAMGAEVFFHSHLPSEHPWVKGLFRIIPKALWLISDLCFFSWLENIRLQNCDYILVIKGEGLTPRFIKALRVRYPDSHIVLFLWDSIQNVRHVEFKYSFFDKIFSFDPVDCKKVAHFNYRPLFFINKYLNENKALSGQGIFFLGTLNGDRPKVIYRLVASLTAEILFDYWLFVRSKIELALRKIVDRSLRKLDSARFLFAPMSSELAVSHFKECLVVLDIEHPMQNGLTMRTFEVIASGKKLITTNRYVKNHDFYDPSRICVIDRYNPIIPPDFIKSDVPPVSHDFISKYSLRGWIKEVLGIA